MFAGILLIGLAVFFMAIDNSSKTEPGTAWVICILIGLGLLSIFAPELKALFT